MDFSARTWRYLMRLWPPFLFSRIRIDALSDDFTYVKVSAPLGIFSRNYNGTMFGGTMFAMTDPFWMVMVHKQLGDDYVVWDKIGEIDYRSPGRTRVHAEFHLNSATVAHLIERAGGGDKVLHWFETDVVDANGTTVAHVRKQVYIRKRATVSR